MKTTATAPQERVTSRSNDTLTNLLLELAEIATDQTYHTKTPSQLETLLGRKLSRTEKQQWRKYRNQKNREIKEAEQRRRKAGINEKREQKRKEQEKVAFSLVGLSDFDLLSKAIELYIANRGEELKGRATLNQLILALNTHTDAEVNQVVTQLENIPKDIILRATRRYGRTLKKYEKNPQNLVDAILRLINEERRNRRTAIHDQTPINQLDTISLSEYFFDLHQAAIERNWEPLFKSILGYKLDDLQNREQVRAFRTRVSSLNLTKYFTQTIKNLALEAIDDWLDKNK